MRIRATMIIRNDAMISARKKLGLTQLDAADVCDVPRTTYIQLEKLDFSKATADLQNRVDQIAFSLGIHPDEVMPEGAIGKQIESRITKHTEVGFERLLDAQKQRLELPSPSSIIEELDEVEVKKGKVIEALKCLTLQAADILRRKFGLPPYRKFGLPPYEEPQQHGEIAKELGMTRQRLHNLHMRAMQKLKLELIRKDHTNLPSRSPVTQTCLNQ